MNGHLEANLGVLRGRFPALERRLRAEDGGRARLNPASGREVLEARLNGGWIQLHSRHDPEGEGARMAGAQGLDESRFVVMVGLGAGYALEAALKRLPDDAQLTAVEPEADVFRKALEMRDLSRALADRRLTVVVGETPAEVARRLDRSAWGLSFRHPCLVEHPSYAALAPDYLREIRKRLLEIFEMEKSGVATRVAGQKEFTRNILKNLPRLSAAAGIAELFGLFKGRPAIVVSAGPSLNKQLPKLRELQGRAVIICVDTAMRAVLAAGVRPDLVVAVDFTPVNFKHFNGVDTSGLPVAAASIVYPRCLEWHKGPLFAIFNDYPITDWLMPFLGSRGQLTIGDSTAHTAFHIAEKMGCTRIILIGQDLAYTGGKTHAEGVATRAEAVAKDDLLVDGWYGDKVRTSSALMTMLKHFEAKVAESPASVVNATEGGARMEGAEHISFAEAAERYCSSWFDAAGAVMAASSRGGFFDAAGFAEETRYARRRSARSRRLAHDGIRCIRGIFTALCEERVDELRSGVARLDAIYGGILRDGELLHQMQGGIEIALMQLRWPDSMSGIPLKHDFMVELTKDRRFLNDLCVASSDFARELKACLKRMPRRSAALSAQTDEWCRHVGRLGGTKEGE